jgi:hypothetical protein
LQTMVSVQPRLLSQLEDGRLIHLEMNVRYVPRIVCGINKHYRSLSFFL